MYVCYWNIHLDRIHCYFWKAAKKRIWEIWPTESCSCSIYQQVLTSKPAKPWPLAFALLLGFDLKSLNCHFCRAASMFWIKRTFSKLCRHVGHLWINPQILWKQRVLLHPSIPAFLGIFLFPTQVCIAFISLQAGSMWMLHALDLGAIQAVRAVAWPGLKLGWRDINVKRRGQGRSCPITLYLVTAIRPQNNRGGKD